MGKKTKPSNKNNQKKKTSLPQETEESEESFVSPNNGSETDYGLEFSTSRLSGGPRASRRCSTLQRVQTEDERSSETYSEDESQVTAPARHIARNVSQRSSTHRPAEASNTNATRGNLPTTSRRKQRKPEQLEKKMNREIANLRSRIDFLIPRLPFSRVVREILLECSSVDSILITKDALQAIQTSAEMYLTQRFEDAYLLTRYRSRVTLEIRDMALVAYFCTKYGKT